MAFVRKYRRELSLLALAGCWMWFLSFAIQLKAGYSTVGDDWSYLMAAKKLYFEGLPDEGRPFGIAALFGFPFLFGASVSTVIKWGIALNFVGWFASVLLVYRILLFRVAQHLA